MTIMMTSAAIPQHITASANVDAHVKWNGKKSTNHMIYASAAIWQICTNINTQLGKIENTYCNIRTTPDSVDSITNAVGSNIEYGLSVILALRELSENEIPNKHAHAINTIIIKMQYSHIIRFPPAVSSLKLSPANALAG